MKTPVKNDPSESWIVVGPDTDRPGGEFDYSGSRPAGPSRRKAIRVIHLYRNNPATIQTDPPGEVIYIRPLTGSRGDILKAHRPEGEHRDPWGPYRPQSPGGAAEARDLGTLAGPSPWKTA
jgi:hypothetical protein